MSDEKEVLMIRKYKLESTPANALYRPEYACDDDWITQFLLNAQLGYVATRWDEQPFITPTNFWYDQTQHEIYFHTNITGRIRANSEKYPQVCFATSQMGKLLPSNVALEFSVQYESVVAFGKIRVLEEDENKLRALYGLIEKYFPGMQPGKHYRPIIDKELKRTSVFAIAIESWSGKRNWSEKADQSTEFPTLGSEWFD